MRGIPYSQEEITYLLGHIDEDYGTLADALNELFSRYNQGTRSRDGVGQWLSRKKAAVVLRVVKIPRPLYDAVGGPALDIEEITIAALIFLRRAKETGAGN